MKLSKRDKFLISKYADWLDQINLPPFWSSHIQYPHYHQFILDLGEYNIASISFHKEPSGALVVASVPKELTPPKEFNKTRNLGHLVRYEYSGDSLAPAQKLMNDLSSYAEIYKDKILEADTDTIYSFISSDLLSFFKPHAVIQDKIFYVFVGVHGPNTKTYRRRGTYYDVDIKLYLDLKTPVLSFAFSSHPLAPKKLTPSKLRYAFPDSKYFKPYSSMEYHLEILHTEDINEIKDLAPNIHQALDELKTLLSENKFESLE